MIKINEVGNFRTMKVLVFLAAVGLSVLAEAKPQDEKEEIIVGAIFHGDDELTRVSFENAIRRVNSEAEDFYLKTKITKISRTDSFKAQEVVCDFLAEGVHVIFGPGTPETSGIVASIAEKFEVPHLTYHWKSRAMGQQAPKPRMTLNLYPDADVLSQAFAAILNDFDWKGYTIVYEDRESLIRLNDILQLTSPKSKPIFVRQLDDDYSLLLKEVRARGDSQVVVAISTGKLLKFFKEAARVEMLTEYNNYFVTNLDMHTVDLSELIETPSSEDEETGVTHEVLSNITSLRLIDPHSTSLRNALMAWKNINYPGMELSEKNVTAEAALVHDAVFVFANALKRYMTDSKILKSTKRECSDPENKPYDENPSGDGFEFMNFMRNTEFNEGMTSTIKFNNEERYNGSRTEFQLEILELYKGEFNKIGVWDQVSGIKYDRDERAMDPSSQVLERISAKTFNIVSKLGEPFFMEKEAKEGEILEGNARYEGYCVDLVQKLAKDLGFKFILERVPDNKYGNYVKATKSWNGLVKHLLDRKADLAIADLTITYERKTAVDFTAPFMSLGIGILHIKPAKKDADLFSFLQPFEPEVWFFTGIAYISVTLFIFVLSRIAPCDWESAHPCIQDPDELESVWKFPNCLWLTIGSMMGQGCDLLPKSASTRIAAGTWWFFALIMLSSYTANLAAFLTMERMDKTINNAEDLAKQVNIKYGTVKEGSTMKFFRQSDFSVYQRMWAFMESNGDLVHVESNDEGVARVKKENGKYAYLMESVPMEYQMIKDSSLRRAGDLLDSKSYGMALRLNSPWRKQFSEQILKLSESGYLTHLKDKWWNKSGVPKEEKTTEDLKIENVGGVFLVIGCGLMVAFFFAFLEFFLNVEKIAITQKISPWKAFVSEMSFAMNLRNNEKPVKPKSISFDESRRSSPPRSLPRSRYSSETRSFKKKSTRSLNVDENYSKSLLNLR